MPEYTYTAITKDGKQESATIQAADATMAGHLLKEQGLLPMKLEEAKKKSVLTFLQSVSSIPLAEKINFVENLAVMLKAGIPLSRGLQIQVKQNRNLRFKNILQDLYSQVESGKTLGDAMSKYPGVFSNIFVSMIRVGELSGNLEKSLDYLTTQLKRDADLRSKTKGAMIYPAVIVSAMVIIGILLSIFVLPSLTSIFKDFDTELPLATRAVVAFADFMSSHAVVGVSGIVAVVIAAVLFYRTPAGKRAADVFVLHFIIINPVVKKINLARFCRILSSLLKSGIPIVQGLEVVAQSMGSVSYRDIVARAAVDVKLGKAMSDSLNKNNSLFPILVVQMIQVGEESGTVEGILEELAAHYEDEVDATLRNLSSIIEPLLLLVIGAVVGVLAYALIVPIYTISQNVS